MSRALRLLLAVAIGAPGTILFFPAVALLLSSGTHGAGDSKTGLLLYLWGMAGLFGLVGFWWWITAETWTKDTWPKRLIATFIAAGAFALLPTFFILNPTGLLGIFAFIWAILGLLVAALAIAQLLLAEIQYNTQTGMTVLPNPSLEPTRYGRHCKPGLSQVNYRLSPGLQYLPTRAAQLER